MSPVKQLTATFTTKPNLSTPEASSAVFPKVKSTPTHTFSSVRGWLIHSSTIYLSFFLSLILSFSFSPLILSPYHLPPTLSQKRWAYLTLNRCSVFTLSALVCVLRACQIRACKMPADSPSSIRGDILSVHLLIIEQFWRWRGAGWVCHEGIFYLPLRFGLNGTFSLWEQ